MIAKTLQCWLRGHLPPLSKLWNAGHYFAACPRCGRDIISVDGADWHSVPKGKRIVWRAPPAGHDRGTPPILPAAPLAVAPHQDTPDAASTASPASEPAEDELMLGPEFALPPITADAPTSDPAPAPPCADKRNQAAIAEAEQRRPSDFPEDPEITADRLLAAEALSMALRRLRAN